VGHRPDYVTVTLMAFDKQSNGRRIEVELYYGVMKRVYISDLLVVVVLPSEGDQRVVVSELRQSRQQTHGGPAPDCHVTELCHQHRL